MMRILSLALLAATLCVNACGSEAPVKIPAPAFDPPAVAAKLQTAVVAGGCFWGVQGVYQHLKGVKSVLSGYAGGGASSADYESVSAGDSGHAG
jgi:peptide-methionine (S)-S-oxide reductase